MCITCFFLWLPTTCDGMKPWFALWAHQDWHFSTGPPSTQWCCEAGRVSDTTQSLKGQLYKVLPVSSLEGILRSQNHGCQFVPKSSHFLENFGSKSACTALTNRHLTWPLMSCIETLCGWCVLHKFNIGLISEADLPHTLRHGRKTTTYFQAHLCGGWSHP